MHVAHRLGRPAAPAAVALTVGRELDVQLVEILGLEPLSGIAPIIRPFEWSASNTRRHCHKGLQGSLTRVPVPGTLGGHRRQWKPTRLRPKERWR